MPDQLLSPSAALTFGFRRASRHFLAEDKALGHGAVFLDSATILGCEIRREVTFSLRDRGVSGEWCSSLGDRFMVGTFLAVTPVFPARTQVHPVSHSKFFFTHIVSYSFLLVFYFSSLRRKVTLLDSGRKPARASSMPLPRARTFRTPLSLPALTSSKTMKARNFKFKF